MLQQVHGAVGTMKHRGSYSTIMFYSAVGAKDPSFICFYMLESFLGFTPRDATLTTVSNGLTLTSTGVFNEFSVEKIKTLIIKDATKSMYIVNLGHLPTAQVLT